MKKVILFNRMQDFEEFINRPEINVIQTDIKVVEQSSLFQQAFAAIVYYEEKEKGKLMSKINSDWWEKARKGWGLSESQTLEAFKELGNKVNHIIDHINKTE